MTSKEKLDVARQLAKLGVDIIEAGFPASSKDDAESVKLIAKRTRCNKNDIDTAWEAVKYAKKPRIHTFIATSEIHLKYKLRKSREQVCAIATEMVAYARSLGCEDVEFSPEDAGSSWRVIKAGATTLNIPDTVGYTLPSEFGKLISDIKSNTTGIEIAMCTHLYDYLNPGANAGARQVEVTINGIGKEPEMLLWRRISSTKILMPHAMQVVMAIKCRGDEQLAGLYTGINTRHIVMASKMVAEYTGMSVQPHKAIVGANAFAHESGIHQDGMLKFKGTYEIMSPEDVGLSRSNESGIVLGRLSGRHALKSRLLELGYELDGKELDDVFWRFKAVAEKKKNLSDGDIEALVSDEVFQPQVVWSVGDMQVTCGTLGLSTATVKLIGAADGVEHVACSVGTGPVDAAYKAIDLIVKVPVMLLEYSMSSVTEGIDAIASTRVVITGTGAGMDIVVSSVRAYVNALNKMMGFKSVSASKVSPESSQSS
ncbi:hypothetical protein MKW92_024432 [Papaver armeniacum]|nr:hypothetical protein MKW92_024432 [Papaver armeniacum]